MFFEYTEVLIQTSVTGREGKSFPGETSPYTSPTSNEPGFHKMLAPGYFVHEFQPQSACVKSVTLYQNCQTRGYITKLGVDNTHVFSICMQWINVCGHRPGYYTIDGR